MASGDLEREQPSASLEAVFKRPYPEQIAFFRQKLGNLIPTSRWTDVWKSAHDQGFMVAGAAKADLLTDLAAAVDKALSEGGSIEEFRKDFDAIVAKHGWAYRGPRNWRTRVILTTNSATSYAAGRLAQLREAGFNFWIYRHTPGELDPRPLHLSWDGLALPADSPWWQTHYPPGGWGCRCYVVGAHSEKAATSLGGELKPAPDDGINPKTGEPNGIDKGWGYMPGDTVSDTVRSTASQIQRWPYDIAKTYLQTVPESVRDDLSQAYRSLPSTAVDVRHYAKAIEDGRAASDRHTLGLVTSSQAASIRKIVGSNVSGFDFSLDPAGVKQGNAQASDFQALPQLIESGQVQPVGNSNQVSIKGSPDGTPLTSYWKIDAPQKTLSLVGFWSGQ